MYWQKNYNSGGVVAEETGKDAKTAHITVLHGRSCPSRINLPVMTKPSRTTSM